MSEKRVHNALDPARRVTIACDGGRTQQHFKDEADVNFIVDRWMSSGQLTHVSTAQAITGEFDTPEDFQDAVSRVLAAEAAFMELPAELRARFANSPAAFISFVSDGANQEEAVALGLAQAPASPPPVRGGEPPEPGEQGGQNGPPAANDGSGVPATPQG